MQILFGQLRDIARPLAHAMILGFSSVSRLGLMQERNQVIQRTLGTNAIQIDTVVGAIAHRSMAGRAAQIAKAL